MRSEGYGSWVCLCFCVSVTQHLTYRMSIRPTNDTTYLTGNEGQKICGFSLNAHALMYCHVDYLVCCDNIGNVPVDC